MEKIIFILFEHFVATQNQWLPEVSEFNPRRDSNPRPSDLQPDAMTIRPQQHTNTNFDEKFREDEFYVEFNPQAL